LCGSSLKAAVRIAAVVHRDEWLDRSKGVKKSGARLTSITMLSGKTYAGKMFIDATYEGDLMAAAGVDYHVGREANSAYGEQWNGVQTGVLHHRHHLGVLKERISPYVVPGDPASGVLPRVSTNSPGVYGQGDKRVQAYCYRMCLTDHPDNRIPFPKPDGYDAKQYELLLRIFAAGWRETFQKFDVFAEEGAVRKSSGARLRLRLAHCVRQHPRGTGLHDPWPVRCHSRGDGHRRGTRHSRGALLKAARTVACRWTGPELIFEPTTCAQAEHRVAAGLWP